MKQIIDWIVKDSSSADVTFTVKNPEDAYNILKQYMQHKIQEHVYVMCLNSCNTVTSIELVSKGTLNSCSMAPRDVFRAAILQNSASIIVAHNHPSGNPSPSDEDRKITKQLISSGKIIGIPVHDHLIITNDTYYSFVQNE